ncbi:SusC/RagA family TonB-linked outer membrane protein [Dyadobacter luteus]|uniref:SusC/RagA family TonB-linked outer membrane protein n=1 Tax=Dyadobacter luteus TaxID=2259619 RepID=A0A3D8Y4G8_9BACT|nr:TonB-dependent receptor [Dyadobacter luteus]REA57172.1 SusC/RagA family TonB-linked outer membrane protein [Dyadobacter luteus]
MKHKYFATLLYVVFSLQTLLSVAQDRTVTGTVRDKSSGDGLPGVSLIIKGSNNGTITDQDGKFSISAPSGGILVVSFVGFNSVEQPLNNSNSYNIDLAADTRQLSEIIVVGYGTQTKAEFTGSAARITGTAVKDIPVQSFDQALAGRAAGVSIAQPNGVLNNPPIIRIRGINSISLSSYPLIVVDGIPINTGNVSADANVVNNPLGDINPADIESIDVLKDAASTSIYGSRAAAGVLLITTKRGKEGKVKVSYEGWTGFSTATRLPKLLNSTQFVAIKNEAVLNSRILAGTSQEGYETFFPSNNADGSLVDTRWYDYLYRTGVSHNHNVSITGGSKSTSYFFSTNFSDQKGFLIDNDFKRKAVRFNIDHEVNSRLKLRASINYNTTFNKSPNSGSLPNNAQLIVGAARMALTLAPNVAPYNADGSYNITPTGQIGNGNNKIVSSYYNPVSLLALSRYTSENDRIIGSFGATLKLLKGLDLTTTYAIDRLRTENVAFLSPENGSSSSTKGQGSNVTGLRNNWNWTSTLNYDRRSGKHHLALLAGYDVQKFENSSWGAYVTQAADIYFNDYQGSWGVINPTGNSLEAKAYLSYFGRLNYDLNDRYFFTANFRRDGNSALGIENKFGNFGGVSAGWALSEESFFKDAAISSTLNSVKFRASWGRVGNGNLSNAYGSQELYAASLYGSAATWAISQAGNPRLGWETSEQTNIGVDLGLLKDRVQVELTWFNNDVNGLILNAPQSPSKGIPGNVILSNVGSLYNRGIELGINANIIRKGDFSWNASFNYTGIRNKVTALADGNADVIGSTHTAVNAFNVTRVGESVGSLYGAKTDGVNPENGRRIFINAKGEKVQFSHVVGAGDFRYSYLDGTRAPEISAADYDVLGNALPKWYGGLVNNFKYKQFDFSVNLTYAGGNYIMNGTKATLRDQRFFNNYTDILDRWTTPGQVTDIPRLVYNDQTSNGNNGPISANVEKGDFLRVQNIGLGYTIPTGLINRIGLGSARIYGQVSNAFIFTKYTGSDPESSVNSNSNTSPGVELNSIGQARNITFGINVGF